MGQGGMTGGSFPAGSMPASQDGPSFAPDNAQNRTSDSPIDRRAITSGSAPQNLEQMPPSPAGPFNGAGDSSPSGGSMGGGMDEIGSPGLVRLFGQGLAGQISWLLPFALIGLLAWWHRPESLSIRGLEGIPGFSVSGGLPSLYYACGCSPGSFISVSQPDSGTLTTSPLSPRHLQP